MAVSRSFNQLANRMRIIGRVIEDNAERAAQVASEAALQAVIEATPVDTAMAVSNWLAFLNAPVREVVPPRVFRDGPASGAQAFVQAIPTIASFTLNQQNITIVNSTPYIGDLERGTSRQAPNGMLPAGILAARNSLIGFRPLRGLR